MSHKTLTKSKYSFKSKYVPGRNLINSCAKGATTCNDNCEEKWLGLDNKDIWWKYYGLDVVVWLNIDYRGSFILNTST